VRALKGSKVGSSDPSERFDLLEDERRFSSNWRSRIPLVAILAVFGWAAITIAQRRSEEAPRDVVTIRLAHWQLEAGVRDGLAEAAAEYQKLHPNVRIHQEAIPESTYGQWMSTQLMGGTAPDIVEAGMVEGHLMTAFFIRYFVPLSRYVSRPNPYNAGTDLENVPLRRTFKDGMRRSFIDETQEFMTIPLALTGVRLFYNKPLLKKLTGLDAAPNDYRTFLEVCEKIRAQRQPNGQPYIAIAGSRFHYSRWDESLIKPLTYLAAREIDFNRDGRFSKEEMLLGFASNKIDFSNRAYEASFRMVREITEQFQSGWSGLTRDEALFNFAQQKAIFLATGTYEAEGIREQAAGKFELGLMDFPLPSQSDPVYGQVVQGPRYENPEGSMPMAVTRTSKHPELAVDFLLFLVSREQNEKFNERLKWIPIVMGAKIDPYIKPFEPTLEGVFLAFDPMIGGESFIKWSQLFSLYQINQISYEDMAAQFTQFYTTQGLEDFREFLRNRRRAQIQDEQLAVGLRSSAQLSTGKEAEADWVKYRNIVVSRQLGGDKTLLNLGSIFSDPAALQRQTFYRYTDQALRNIRKSLEAKSAKATRSNWEEFQEIQ
jgi:ABC-type glycerol-3-phosphate transport system substrate-binding protein